VHNGIISLPSRELRVPEYCGPIAKFTFDELCVKPKGAVDYIALCERFHTIFVTDIPRMSLEHKMEAKRFLIFIDAVYEHKVKFICSADGPANQLFGADNSYGDAAFDQWHKQHASDPLKLNEESNMFSGQEELFQFARAVSRLVEMQSSQYLRSSSWKTMHPTPVDVPGTPAPAATTRPTNDNASSKSS
jgi:peroxisome-assembly ATPase